MEKITIKNLTFIYPQKKEPALKNISFEVKKGEFIVLFGKSGCGKSTLLKMLKPLLSPAGEKSGNVFFDGNENLSSAEQAKKIGFVMQNPDSQIVCDKVWHELAFGLENLSVPKNEIRSKVAETASFFGIQNWFYKSTSELSGGEKQLLNLASAMVLNPELLILDEPTSQLDPIAAYDFFKILEKINKELGTTVIMSEHRPDDVFSLADRVIAMENGKIISCEKPELIGEPLKQSELFFSLPTPCRIFYQAGGVENAPLTVRNGHDWLYNMPTKDVVFKEKFPPCDTKIIELRDIWFKYEKNLPDILKGLSLDVFRGEFYAVVGGNGSGKTTALSVISEINKPYRGKMKINGTLSVLPQNPQTLFSEKTVRLNLLSACSSDKDEKILDEVIELCELGNLLECHPFDLSGGEMQKAALASVLLSKPDILVLDEPTKGLDSSFKMQLAELLLSLKNKGVTVIMVSHDIEFCAKYADRCGMFFDGKIISQDTPRNFFAKNNFYTTTAARMAKGIIPNAILEEDILLSLGAEKKQPPKKKTFSYEPKKEENFISARPKKVFGIFFAVCSAIAVLIPETKEFGQILSLIFLLLAFINFIPQKEFSENHAVSFKKTGKNNFLPFLLLIAVVLTIAVGLYLFKGRKYYFVSLLVIVEICGMFAIRTEFRKPHAKELVLIASITAAAVSGRAVFSMLPQFKPVTAIVIITGMTLGSETGFLVGALTGFVSNFLFGQGPWTPWQMFAWGFIGLLSGLLFESGYIRKTKLNISVFGFIATFFIYGLIMNTATVLIMNPSPNFSMLLTAYTAGIPFDLVHAVSSVFFLWVGGESMYDKLERIKTKYGFYEIGY